MKKLIVLIEDSDAVRFALGELLRATGYEVIDTADGQKGLALIDSLANAGRHPDLLVTDLVMDDVAGYEVIKHAKRRFPGRPVIAISGGTRSVPPDLPLDLAKRNGADLCLSKPFGNDELIVNIRRLIDASSSRNERRS